MRIEELQCIAAAANDLRSADPNGAPSYDMLSHALVWDDELPLQQVSDLHLLRPLLRYRTCIIMGEAPEYEEWWVAGKKLFPDWIGFRPDRCNPSDALREVFSAGLQKAVESIKRHVS